MSRISTILFTVLFAFCATSCSVHRRAGKTAQKATVVLQQDSTRLKTQTLTTASLVKQDSVKPVAVVDSGKVWAEMLKPLWKQRMAYHTFSGKAKVHYEAGENSQDFTANFRVRKDSVIWLTITAMGGMVQAARVLITADSILMINYLDKEVIAIPLSEAAKVLPVKVDYLSLQNLIMGEPPRDGAITRATKFNGMWALDVRDTGYLQHITYKTGDSTMVQGQIRTIAEGGPMAMIEYGEYEVADQNRISTRRLINIQNGQEAYSVDIKFISESFDQELDFPFVMPATYSRKK